jgi:hypothetical protein
VEYGENGCFTIIDDKGNGKNPYMLLNIEELYKSHGINSSSHCDFIYIYYDNRDNKFHIYFVELKNINSNDFKNYIEDVRNKFHQTDDNEQVEKLLKCLNIVNPKKYYILVLPREKIWSVKSLLKHVSIQKVLKKGYTGGLAPCGGNIREFYRYPM